MDVGSQAKLRRDALGGGGGGHGVKAHTEPETVRRPSRTLTCTTHLSTTARFYHILRSIIYSLHLIDVHIPVETGNHEKKKEKATGKDRVSQEACL